jgi:hypothetical protein
MADLTSDPIASNFNKFVISQSDAGREIVVSVVKDGSGNLTDAILLAVYRQLTVAGGTPGYNAPDTNGPDAFTVAAVGTADGSPFVSGTTTTVFLRLQGSGGTPNTTTVSGAAITVVATFTPAL